MSLTTKLILSCTRDSLPLWNFYICLNGIRRKCKTVMKPTIQKCMKAFYQRKKGKIHFKIIALNYLWNEWNFHDKNSNLFYFLTGILYKVFVCNIFHFNFKKNEYYVILGCLCMYVHCALCIFAFLKHMII